MSTFPLICAAMNEAMAGKNGERIRKKFNALVVFEVDGEEAFHLDASSTTKKKRHKGGASPSSTADKPATTLTVTTTLQVLQDLLDKKITPQQAFMKGKIKVKGKMALAMKLQIILDATRKQLSAVEPVSRL